MADESSIGPRLGECEQKIAVHTEQINMHKERLDCHDKELKEISKALYKATGIFAVLVFLIQIGLKFWK